MIEVEETDAGLRVVDVAKNELEVRIEDWERGGPERSIDRRVHETVSGTASEIRFPDAGAIIQSHGRDRLYPVFDSAATELATGRHLIQIDRTITAFVDIVGAGASCENTRNSFSISFPERQPVTLAFRSIVDLPDETLRVPPTPRGFASALTELGESPWTESPDRSYPSMRGHPPLLEADEDVDVGREAGTSGGRGPDRPIRIRVPPSFEPLFVLSPLAYYLAAGIVVDDVRTPTLETDDLRLDLGTGAELPEDAARLLRRVFSLDCLVRNAGPYGVDVDEMRLLEGTDLDPDAVYDLPLAERLERYLSFPFESVSAELPRWPLVTYLDPVARNLSVVPHLLDRFSLVAPPDPVPVDVDEFVARSLGDFHRSAVGVHPETGSGFEGLLATGSSLADVRGWIAAGKPIDAFKATPEAFENRLSAFERSSGPISITVVMNDPTMGHEREEVVEVYRDPNRELSMDLSVVELPATGELLDVFGGDDDFVHYIGHCDPEGLRCTDGTVSMRELSESRIQTFFLNACGSYREGLELIRKGAVSGGVTFGDVIDEQATKVGTRFARFLMKGYDTFTSLSFARNRAILNRQYSVVGDGTHVLSQRCSFNKFTYYSSKVSDDEFSLQVANHTPWAVGAVVSPSVHSKLFLSGNDGRHDLDEEQFQSLLDDLESPMFYEDEFYWPEDLLDELF